MIFGVSIIYGQKINIGIKAGGSLVGFKDSKSSVEFSEIEPRLSYHFGGFAEYKVKDEISIQADVVFSSQGAQLEEVEFRRDSRSEPILYTPTYTYNYLNIPVVFKYYVTNGFNIFTGLQLGILLSAKFKSSSLLFNMPTDENEVLEFDFKEFTTPVDISGVLGLGYQFKKGFLVDLRGNFGLNDINPSGSFAQRKNRVLQLSVGYRF